jgi:two-component system chemotaxis sensor kinase CheA
MADDDLTKDFLIEAYEGLDRLDNDFLALEQDPGNRERLAGIFRTIHTIKGNSGFLGLSKLQGIAHAGENLLSLLRDGKLQLTPEIANALLSLVDAIRQILASIEAGRGEGEVDYTLLVTTLDACAAGRPPEADPLTTSLPQDEPAQPPPPAATAPPAGPPASTGSQPALVRKTPAPASTARPPTLNRPVAPQHRPGTEIGRKETEVGLADSMIRVDVHLLDRLMNLVGELVLTRNQVLQHVGGREMGASGREFGVMAARLDQLTSELQEGVMKTRMQPIATVWSKLPRVVRDLAASVRKQVRVEMSGQDTELDKSVIEAIKDPLTHIVRNSVDHGIESPDRRVAAGKPAEGCLRLTAGHEGGQVVIRIIDDGGGVDPQRIRSKAVEKGLITHDQAARLSDNEAVNLIFLPGFSTAEQVTNISGRGVGMDVVKTNIERIGGRVGLETRVGLGTTLTMTIPLTLAIIPALVVTSGGERFALPQAGLRELVRLEGDQIAESIEDIYGARFHRLRGVLLPLIDLNAVLGLGGTAPSAINIVVLQADGQQFGVVVDSINDSQEIVVKPLSPQVKGLGLYAGSTIMGDGQVALILDVGGLSRQANLTEKAKRAVEESRRFVRARDTASLLIFQALDNTRMALPLDSIARLEELPAERIESVAGREMIQYRGGILPLVRIMPGPDHPSVLQTIVHARPARDGGEPRPIGLVVGAILDTEAYAADSRPSAGRPGTHGCLVVGGKVTELLDIDHAIANAWPEWLEQTVPADPAGARR